MRKVLVIVDMQNDFTTGALGNKECEAAIPEVIKVVNDGDYDEVFLTRDTHGENYMDTQEGRKLPVIHTQKGTDGWQVVTAIAEAVDKKFDKANINYVDKPTFGSIELQNTIKDLSDKYVSDGLTIDFVGVCTGICVISNAIPAKMYAPEATIRVIEKACACVTPQSHTNAIEAMKTCQIDIV